MVAERQPARGPEEWEVVITRVFDAPRELVFKAWTDCGLFRRWWGPKGYTTPFCQIDARPGGQFFSSMRSPEGQEYWSKGVCRELVAPERLVMTDSFADEKGNIVPASYYGMGEDWPIEMLISVRLEEHEGKTRLTLRHGGAGAIAAEARRDMEQGWNESFDKLVELLQDEMRPGTRFIAEPGSQTVLVSRIYDAPRERLFKLFTDPALIPEWWGPKAMTTTVDRMNVRAGGKWRIVQRDADGNEFAFKGVYHDVSRPERVVNTFELEGEPGHVMLETVTFEEMGDKTKATDRVVFQSVEDRDAAVQSGMESGAVESMERMADLIARLE